MTFGSGSFCFRTCFAAFSRESGRTCAREAVDTVDARSAVDALTGRTFVDICVGATQSVGNLYQTKCNFLQFQHHTT